MEKTASGVKALTLKYVKMSNSFKHFPNEIIKVECANNQRIIDSLFHNAGVWRALLSEWPIRCLR